MSANHPGMLVSCNADLEYLINDPNRAISALAISTLLKTVSENKYVFEVFIDELGWIH